MTVRERMLALRLKEKLRNDPQYARQLGVSIEMIPTPAERKQRDIK